jgi:hypothetical protein
MMPLFTKQEVIRGRHLDDGLPRSPSVSDASIAADPSAIALGIMVVPNNLVLRVAARASWLPEARKYATTRWVAGDVPCARNMLREEAELHGDVVFVPTKDCQKWHSPHKVHAWYQYALRTFLQAAWIAKMEDDGLLWTSALADLLWAVRHSGHASIDRSSASVYVGMLQWQGGCTLSEVGVGTPSEQKCNGCWGGWYRGGAAAPRDCHGMWREGWAGSVRQGTDACPAFQLAPFACGPFEARSRHLAQTVARCEYADRYFRAMSRRGDARQNWCVSTDGGQGHVLGACIRSMHAADLGAHIQKYATKKQLNESRSVLIVHPIKSRGLENNPKLHHMVVNDYRRTWEFLLRAPFKHKPISLSRIVFKPNETRPFVERVQHGVSQTMRLTRPARR